MKYVALFMLTACSSSFETNEEQEPTKEVVVLYYYNENSGSPICPPKLQFTTIKNGRAIVKTIFFNCNPAIRQNSPASDGSDWGNDFGSGPKNTDIINPAPVINPKPESY
jgi:hypothetical protein